MSHMNIGQPCIIVEDDRYTRRMASQMLTGVMRPMEASTAQEAIELMAEVKPALVLIDYHLPDMKLPELVAVIKQMYPELRIIAMSADATAETIGQSRKAGVPDFLAKPLTKETLLNRVMAPTGNA